MELLLHLHKMNDVWFGITKQTMVNTNVAIPLMYTGRVAELQHDIFKE